MKNEFEYALELEEALKNAIGHEELLEALIRAMGIDDIIENFEYIARCYDVEIENN